MLRKIRELMYRGLGLNLLRTEISRELSEVNRGVNELMSEVRETRMLLTELKQIPQVDHGVSIDHVDAIFQRRLDEKLDFYFKWRLPLSFPENGKTLIHTNDGHRLYVDPKEPFITLHLLEHGEWETPVRREIRRELTAGSTFIDIGANIGLHTLFAAALVGETGRVYAVEPHPVTMDMLRSNLEINGLLERVGLAQVAVSDVDDGVVEFEYFAEHPAMSGIKVSPVVIAKFQGTLKRVSVSTITLDALVEREALNPDLVKIDVEGFEFSVSEGCVRTIDKFPNVRFLMEYEKAMAEAVMRPGIGAEIAEFFERRGFKIYKVEPDALAPQTYEEFRQDTRGDYIFAR